MKIMLCTLMQHQFFLMFVYFLANFEGTTGGSKSPTSTKKRKAPPPPPQRGCSLTSIPSGLDSESSGESPTSNDITTPDYRHVTPRVHPNGVVIMEAEQQSKDANNYYELLCFIIIMTK